MQKYHVLLLFLFLFSAGLAYSQNSALLVISQEDWDTYHRKVQKEFMKSECYSADKRYRILPCFGVYTVGKISKTDFYDSAFLKKLKPNYYYAENKRKKILWSNTSILDEEKNKIASFDYRFGCLEAKDKKNAQINMIDSLWPQEEIFIFYIGMTDIATKFIVTPSMDVYISYMVNRSYKISPIKEYIEENWIPFSDYWRRYGLIEEE